MNIQYSHVLPHLLLIHMYTEMDDDADDDDDDAAADDDDDDKGCSRSHGVSLNHCRTMLSMWIWRTSF